MREIKAAAVIITSSFSRVKDVQSKLKGLKRIQTFKMYNNIVQVYSDVQGWLSGQQVKLICYRKKQLGIQD